MTRRKWMLLAGLVLVLTIGAELVIRPLSSSKGRVQIVNAEDTPMDDLVVSYGGAKVALGTLKAGKSTAVWFTAADKGTLNLAFHQKGNPMEGFQVAEFDPAENLKSGLKMVLIVRANRVERFLDDDESTTALKSMKESVGSWFEPAPMR